jgi:uncharacterized membrane protein YfcA
VTPAELLGTVWGMAAVCGIAFVAGLAHGLSGFGFPLISTPMVALFADVRTAVVVTLLPNIMVNSLSAFGGSGWREALRKYWLIPLYVLVGTVTGAQVVLWAPANPLRLLLAAVIVIYLQQDRFRRVDWSVIARNPNGSGLAFGLVAGFFSGTVNVMLPPLLIYFSTLGLAPLAMTQVMNACFLVGKVSQAAVFAARGQFTFDGLALTVPVCAVTLAGYSVGRRLQPRASPAAYRKMMRAVLWTMAALLTGQAAGVIGAR